ncbi:MAG TPA: hypothetical protein EYP90_03040 [Chromatiaceae bacterium]|nr:hypothetical protein [Chromatiaceae bacterium]HIP73165.1 hypothetical protein [Anaerolineae bacterium]
MIANVQPQWIAKMYPSKAGRDHLGLGSVSSDQILPTLSPAINVLTIHPRYYSFYAFLLDEFIRHKRKATRSAWVAFYRPREFIFSIGAYLRQHHESKPEHGDMGNVIGGRKTAPLARNEQETYNTLTDYIDSDLGGYGLYYRSVMAELGLIYPGGRGLPYPVDVPSEKGQEVAAAFRQAVKDTVYYRDYFVHDATEVPIEVIHEYIDQACLCQLQNPSAPDRSLLLDLFLHGGTSESADARRATFQFLLDIADQTQGHAVDQDTYRQLIYFHAADNGSSYRPCEHMTLTHARWRQYQVREYYSFALNAMWDYLCHWGLSHHGDFRPLPTSLFWEHLVEALDFNRLAGRFNIPSPGISGESGFQQLLGWLTSLAGADGLEFDEACGLQTPVHEHRLYSLALGHRIEPDVMVAGMVTMLAVIYLRFGHPECWQRPEWEIAKMGRAGRLPLHGFIQDLRQRIQGGPITINEIARWLYRDYIMLQHQVVATQKLPDNTFRFRREGTRLQFYNLENRLSFMDSRYDALSTMIHELGLCGNLYHLDHPLTADGRLLLERGDLS